MRLRRPKAVVFVDYEHWFYSYRNKFNMTPNVEEWFDEINAEYKIKEAKFFADFNNNVIGGELPRLEKLKYNISVVHTASMKDGVDKDFTDFIILDAIYREAANKKGPEVYILFTGDGHFNLAVKYLRSLNKKVIIYAARYSLSNKLKSSANAYVEMPRQGQEQNFYIDLVTKSLKKLEQNGKVATYWKTIQNVAAYNKVSQEKIQNTVDGMINQKLLYEEKTTYKGRSQQILKADWNRIDKREQSNA